MIYTDQTFWCYLCNESQFLVNQVKEMLTKNYYDFDTKKKKTVIYYQNVNKIEIDNFIYETIRFPAGLIKYITDKLPIEVDRKQRVSRTFKEDDVRNYANIVHGFNEKFEVRDYQIDAAMSSLNRFTSLIYSSVGSGKGQPISLKIPTPDGFKSFGDLKVGDNVFGRNGKSTKIIGVFPQGLKDIYRFKFSSGQETTCDISHLWTFCNRNGKNKITISTDELLKRNDLHKNFVSGHGCEHSYYCLSNDPVQYESKVYEIDPYVLGVKIGDGNCTAGVVNIASPDTKKFIRDKVSERLDKEYSIKMEWHRTCPHFNIIQVNKKGKDGFIKKVKQLGLDCKSTDKFIPKEYLEGSINQRIDLLHGLMDTDGACISRTKHSSISYSTTSLQLAKDVQQLVFSLGGICRFYKPDTRKQNPGYTLLIQFDSICPFSLDYKKERWIPYKEKVYLKEIEYVGKEKTVCIKVSNSDELYITSDYVLTHNTSVMSLVCKILSNDRILITNGNNFILQQIYDRLLSFDITDVSWNPSKEPDYSKRIVLINTKSSDERLNKQDINYLNFLKKVNCWIIDECFSGNTEILTNEGWKCFKDLTGHELFANFKADTSTIYFSKGKLIKRWHNGKCIDLKTNRNSHITMTPNHQQLYISSSNKIKKDKISDITLNGNRVFCSGKGIGKKEHLSTLDKIIIAIQADGCASNRHDFSEYQVSFSKKRKIDKWLELIKNFNGSCVELKSDCRLNKTRRRWRIVLPGYENKKAKSLYKCFNLEDFSNDCAKEFIEEIINWDGWKSTNGNSFGYDSIDKKNTDFVSAVATLGGYSSYQTKRVDNRSVKFNDSYRVILKKQNTKLMDCFSKTYVDYNDYVYCVEVPEHNIIVRGNGDKQYTFVSGNCQHFQSLTSLEPWFYMDENNLQRVIGYSGSPFRNYEHPYNNEDDFVLISLLGEPSFTYTMKDSIGDENVAQPYSYFINYPNKEAWVPPHLKDNYFVQYRMNIIHNKARNRAGIELLKYLDKYGVKTLASINNIKPGQNLMKTLKEEGVKSQFICGDNTIHEWVKNKRGTLKLETRTNASTNDIKQAFEDGYNIIFGSSVLDEGVDIEEFQAVVLFSAGKTPIAGIQRLGRCSRKKKEGKNISFVIDFKDINGNYIFQSHYEQRKKMMRDSGVINIEKVQDFCKMIQELNKE